MQIALVVFPGVSVNECEAFTLAFRQLAESGLGACELIGVGAAHGEVVGVGGRQRVDATFDEVANPDVVLVPGGLGVERTAHDDELLSWLRRVEPGCQWLAASSTGTVVVAAAGLLGDHPAATHWLAGDKLAEYGSAASPERIVEVGHVLTCHGHVSAMDVALLMIIRLFNRPIALQVRNDLAHSRGHVVERRLSVLERLHAWRRWNPERSKMLGSRGESGPIRPRNEELDTSTWIEMELEPDRQPDRRANRSPWDKPG